VTFFAAFLAAFGDLPAGRLVEPLEAVLIGLFAAFFALAAAFPALRTLLVAFLTVLPAAFLAALLPAFRAAAFFEPLVFGLALPALGLAGLVDLPAEPAACLAVLACPAPMAARIRPISWAT
jgi:hypothetical protein